LIELVIVISIVSIMAGAVSIGIGVIDKDTKLGNAANRALADIRYAQEVAMSERRQVNFNMGSSGYSVTYQAGGYVQSPYNPAEAMVVDFNDEAFSGVSITSTAGGNLSFSSTGAPLLNASPVTTTTSVMTLNGKASIMLYSSGMTELFSTGGGGC